MALEQHAIPTEVTRYEFRLVGDMTLKQFGWLAGGILLAILSYSTPIPFYFKWPLVALFGFGGAAIAFVPYEGRTLDRWILAFVRAIYAPTEFIWIKERSIPKYMEKNKVQPMPTVQKKMTAMEQAKLQEYIQSLPRMANVYQVDQQEAAALSQINQLFDDGHHSLPATATHTPPIAEQATFIPQPVAIDISNYEPSEPQPIDLEALSQQIAQQTEATIDQPPVPQEQPPETPEPDPDPEPLPEDNYIEPESEVQQAMAGTSELVSKQIDDSPVSEKLPEPDLIFMPSKPTQPNIIVGVVVDNQNQPLDNIVLEILNDQGFPVRALKTNKMGHFAIATPLKDGQYQIIAENPQHQFSPVQVSLKNKILDPVKIIEQ